MIVFQKTGFNSAINYPECEWYCLARMWIPCQQLDSWIKTYLA